MIRKLGGLALLAFVLFFAITNPHTAADAIRAIAAGLGTFAAALAHGGS